MSFKNRLAVLERQCQNNKPILPGLVLFVRGQITPEQQTQIDEAEAIGQKVIIFTVINATADKS